MFKRFRAFAGQFFSQAGEGYAAGSRHPGAAYDPSRETLELAALAEREKVAGFRRPPGTVPPTPRRTPAEERKRIDDMPIP